ncbi:MAG TPA: hypothetical protein VKH83_04755 [Methylomirabilota bacterium]|nr:hypothetical protein [Methylomirabilota bacterium]
MEVIRKPLAKIEGRKRMQASGLTVAWYGTRSLKDWVAYLEDGNDDGRLVLAYQVSERAVKGLLARIQTLSRDDLRAIGRPVEAVAQQGGGPPARSTVGGEAPGPGLTGPSASSRQLVLTGNGDGQAVERPRRRRMAAAVESVPTAEVRRPARSASRDVAGTLRQLRSRIETLETEQEHLRAELAVLRGEAEGYDGPPSIFVIDWFRATLVLTVLAIVVVITVPWLMAVFDGGAREPRPPVRSESAAPTPR